MSVSDIDCTLAADYDTLIIQELRMGRAGQHFQLFDSIFDRVNTFTTQHIIYA